MLVLFSATYSFFKNQHITRGLSTCIKKDGVTKNIIIFYTIFKDNINKIFVSSVKSIRTFKIL